MKSKFSKSLSCAFAFTFALVALGATARAGDEPDLIFRKSTTFKLLTPNDKLATYAIDDPLVAGVACYYTVPERGGVAGMFYRLEPVEIEFWLDRPSRLHERLRFKRYSPGSPWEKRLLYP